ncbi:MAG: AAA domain-containing protein, partial [Dehalococcoidales bacterium]|nr:AAA domain-containing protein [Dehalococcoidales bacterium]
MISLEERVLEAVKAKPGQKARDIAARLGVDRRTVNSALYGGLKGKVQVDNGYRWYPKGPPSNSKAEDEEVRRLDTPLAKLCRYYLDCLSHDDLEGVSEFAASKYGRPNYVELRTLPMYDEDEGDPFDTEDGRRLLGRVRRDRNRQVVFLGYPTYLSFVRSRSGWEGFIVEPILLWSFHDADNGHGSPTLVDELPQFNFRALRSLLQAGESTLMEEAMQLADELGLGNQVGEEPELDELLPRLREKRSDWEWREDPDPYALSIGAPLATLDQQGIYNRAVLIAAERSPYTKGLESELGELQSIEESKYQETALGSWLTRRTIESPPANQQPLLEVLPLNSEQHQAVRQALSNPLTVITGPPGTGKSQVVTSILVNAAWQGKTVLFASKNNKAVDVVETRANALGPRPVLLRLGANQYQRQLAAYLVGLL